MELERKLLQLDEAIWKQYEKVTQYAEKYAGWDKYDLVKGCNNLIAGGMLATGVYTGILSLEQQNLLNTLHRALSVAAIGMAGSTYFIISKDDDLRKQREQRDLQEGIIKIPVFQKYRLLLFPVAMAAFVGSGLCAEVYLDPNYASISNFFLLNSLFCFSGGFYASALISKSYFRDQIPKPPSKSPGKLQEWYRSFKESFGRKEAVGAKYDTLEEKVVGD